MQFICILYILQTYNDIQEQVSFVELSNDVDDDEVIEDEHIDSQPHPPLKSEEEWFL